MGEGLIQFLVVAAFVIISMMDAAARRRRKEAQGKGNLPTAEGFPEAADDLDEVSESSEGLALQDVWQEVAALARGEVPASQREEPETPDQAASHEEHAHERHAEVASPPRPEELQPEELPREFVPHPPEQPSKPQQEPRPAQPGRSLLRGVRRGAKSSLREAIILAEVLSPPVTLRDSGWTPTF